MPRGFFGHHRIYVFLLCNCNIFGFGIKAVRDNRRYYNGRKYYNNHNDPSPLHYVVLTNGFILRVT